MKSIPDLIKYGVALVTFIIILVGIALPQAGQTVTDVSDGQLASASYTYSGVPADGKFLNITHTSNEGATTTECYEYDPAGTAAKAACTAIHTGGGSATAVAGNTSTTLNSNSDLVTASNSSATVTLTSEKTGVEGNNIETSETSDKAGDVSLSGGTESLSGGTAALAGLIGLVIVAAIIMWIIRNTGF